MIYLRVLMVNDNLLEVPHNCLLGFRREMLLEQWCGVDIGSLQQSLDCCRNASSDLSVEHVSLKGLCYIDKHLINLAGNGGVLSKTVISTAA